MDLHHQHCASKAHALLVELQGSFMKWSVRPESHQHLPGYEPDALTVKLQTNENGRIPRCCPGRVLVPNQARTADSLVSDEKVDVRPGLALGNAVLRTADSALCLAHELKWFPQPVLPRRRFVHNEECCCYTMKGVLKWILR